jgi:hypothetical protein
MQLPENLDSYNYSSKNIDSVISLLAGFHVITGLLTIPQVYAALSTSLIEAPTAIVFMYLSIGIVLAATVPFYIVIGGAIWSLQSWAWRVAVVVNVICLFFNLFGGVILTAILNIVLLLILNNSDVRLALSEMVDY